MKNPISFYNSQLKTHQSNLKKQKKKLLYLSSSRLFTFLFFGFGIYYFFYNWQVSVIIAIIGISIFLYLLSIYTNVKAQAKLSKAFIAINTEELEIASGNFHDRDQGLEFQDAKHFYSLDIDLFGRGSFFQFINRTTIKEGTHKIANLLIANNINGILNRQEAIKELSEKPKWRQHYTAIASLVDIDTPAKTIINWLKHYKPFLHLFFKWLPVAFAIVSTVLFVITVYNINNVSWLGYWLLFGLIITGIYLKRINSLSASSDKLKETFKQYALLLDQIENETFKSSILKEKQIKIQSENKKASLIFKELSRALDALDNRNNLFSAILGNGLLLWDIQQSYRIERWIANYAHKVEDWFEVVSFFDAYNSLGNFAFNHPNYAYPNIKANSNTIIKSENLGHPLLDKSKRIDSDLYINNEQFFIVTGANMAGKSTFLRTVSLHIVMANVGLPVCAKASHYSPVKLITSMRTSDSLTDDSSYFFSELTRLKFIVDEIEKEPYFIVLDEILKGTNSTDKAIGSKKFVEKLVASKATGIIATHDLSLCEIENNLDEVENYFFDAQIINDELHFDYKFKQGICQNMNASFLLKKMNIVE